MKNNNIYDYEQAIMDIDQVLDFIDEAIKKHKPLSISRFGHGEIAYMGWLQFPNWTKFFEPNSSYAGATASIATIKEALIKALKATDIVGFHTLCGKAMEDQEAAKLTLEFIKYLDFRPKHVCSAFITHEMIKNDRFWRCLKDKKIALVGRRAAEAYHIFEAQGIHVVYTTILEGYEEIEIVYDELYKRTDWDIALLSAGIPATILAPRLAKKTNKVVIDFGHALDKLIDGENFNYEKILRNWKARNTKKMLVSMVMAVHNGEIYLKEALDSMLSQTYKNIEIIIVNDGSTDTTKDILDQITDNRVRVIHLKDNRGAANALNIGIKEANGSWIAIQDADDNSYPTRIEEQVKYVLEHPLLVGVGSFIECISGRDNISEYNLKSIAQKRNFFRSREEIRKNIYYGCPLTHSSVMFSKDSFFDVGGYNTDFKIVYDYDLWLRLLEKGEIENVPKVLVQYRMHNESLSNKNARETLKEIQIASSRAIYRLFRRNKNYMPKVMVIGSKKGCENYKEYIAPNSGLKVEAFIHERWQVPYISRCLKEGKIDAIIVLDGRGKDKIMDDLKRRGLKLNTNVFCLYNF
ncbi:GT-D fold domain-containing glycosyltransferase [Crassaminicella indica]|uniref:Glycosyltransferase n=1 Tax=Crassaminicella indica TaxID=2855394 RepID=A0ABX8RAA3_9CLOT|nr:GT-D fold domain-containing glycosyltransferase [Crassaminicella indica]QXM05394.1 glycosyltransferase [Crassaminicella indica]